MRNLLCSLVRHERVITTREKAKEARPLAERLVTLARGGTLHDRRLAFSRLRDGEAVHKLFSDISQRNPSRRGGYTRILTLDRLRLGDRASQAVFEWVDGSPEAAKQEDENEVKATVEKKVAKKDVKPPKARKAKAGAS